MMLERHREESSSLDVDAVADIAVSMDRNSREVVDEDQSDEKSNLDEVISLRNVHSKILIDETDVLLNLN